MFTVHADKFHDCHQRPDMKTHIANMDRELAKLADAVTRERWADSWLFI